VEISKADKADRQQVRQVVFQAVYQAVRQAVCQAVSRVRQPLAKALSCF
jgi:hypothetical protein